MDSNTREELIARIRQKRPELHSDYGVSRIGLFGSCAIGNPRPGSDVDIVVEFDRSIGMRFVDLADFLQRLLSRPVDILTLAGIAGIRNREIAESIRRSIVYV